MIACSDEKYPAFSDSKYLDDFATYSNNIYVKDTLHIKKMNDCYSVSRTAFYVDKGHLTNGVTRIIVMENILRVGETLTETVLIIKNKTAIK